MSIDLQTLSLVLGLSNLLQFIALFVQYRVDRTHRGLGWWALGSALLGLGFAANYLRVYPPLAISAILLNNLLFGSSTAAFYLGILRFFDQHEPRRLLIAFSSLFALLLGVFTFVNDDLELRRVLISVAVAIFAFASARVLFVSQTASFTASARFLALVFLGTGGFFILRAVETLFEPAAMSAFFTTLTQATTLLVILSASTLWTFGFVILVNQRLTAENREARATADLIFNTSPDAVLITRLDDGAFVIINDGFTTLTGYTRSEVLDKTTLAINIWRDPTDRHKVVTAMREQGACDNLEAVFQHKNGHQIIGMLSARRITLQGTPHVLSVTRDITERKQIEEALRESEEKFRYMTENSSDVIWHLDEQFRFTYISPADERMRGFHHDEVLGTTAWSLLKPEGVKHVKQANNERLATELHGGIKYDTLRYELEQICKDGHWIWTEVNVTAHYDQEGRLIGYHGVSRDISVRKQAEAALRESEQRYRLLADHAYDVIWTMTLEGRFTYVSPSVYQLRGFTPEEVLQQPLADVVCPGSIATVQEGFQRAFTEISTGQSQPIHYFEIEQPCKDGSTVWTEATARVMYDDTGQPLGLVGVTRDISARKRLEAELQHQATTDGLTGIVNRRRFMELAENELVRALRLNRALCIALIDIDHFKQINDSYGHAVGDQALLAWTRICQKNIRVIDLLGRWGGDEFVLLLPETTSAQAQIVTQRVCDALDAEPIDLGDKLVAITISSGIASLAGATDTLDHLLERADRALYQAKAAGRNRVMVEPTLESA